VVVGLLISFYAATAGGATMAGLSVAQFFIVLAFVEAFEAVAKRRRPASVPGVPST